MIERILILMKEKEINGIQLANETGLPKNAISEWKKEKAKPGTDAVIKIAQYFKVSSDYLLGLTDDPEPYKKEYTPEDRLNRKISKLTEEKRKKAESYVDFLKTEEEFFQELSDKSLLDGAKPQPI